MLRVVRNLQEAIQEVMLCPLIEPLTITIEYIVRINFTH
jgi:hypothetical protein